MNSTIAKTGTMIEAHPLNNSSDQQIDVVALLRKLWRRRFLIVVLTVLPTLLAAYVILNLTPRYKAESQVMIDDRRLQVLSFSDVISARERADDVVLSEVQVIGSRDLAKTTVRKLGLMSDPEFNPALTPPSAFASLRASATAALKALLHLPSSRPDYADGEDATERRVVDAFISNLYVSAAGRSRVIRIVFESNSPATAAAVVNTLAEFYQERQVEAKALAAKRATQWLDERLTDLRDKAEHSRLEKEQYRRQHGLLQSARDMTLATQEAAELNRELVLARAKYKEAEARLAHVKKAVASGEAASTSEVLQSLQIQTLRQQEAGVRQRIADLRTTYGPQYPRVVQAQAELADVQRTLAQATDRIVQAVAADVTRERANVDRLTAMFEQAKQVLGQSNEAEAKLATIDRQLQANDALYGLFLDRVRQTDLQQTLQRPDSQVISHADQPDQPFFPRRTTLAALAALVSSIFAGFVALLLERNKGNNVLCLADVQNVTSTDCLGFVPMVKRLGHAFAWNRLAGDQLDQSRFGEELRSIYARLLISSEVRPRIIMFASALPGEGKTTSSIAFALMMAKGGRRTVIVDCDTRRPQVHAVFGRSRDAGLTDFLRGRLLDEVTQPIGESIDLVTAGSQERCATDLFSLSRMKLLLTMLEARYDLVILDSPPVMAVPDALMLAPMVSKIVFLVQWAKTPQAAAARGIQLLRNSGGDVAGSVLSMVDFAEMAVTDPSAGYYRKIHRYLKAA